MAGGITGEGEQAMILNEDVQLQIFRQAAYGTDPTTPNGILMPRGANFTPMFDRKFIDNPQIFADGIEREPGLGNQESGNDGDVVPNLNFFPYIQKAIAGALVETGTGPYTKTSTGIARTALLHLFEWGYIPLSLYYKFYDMVLEEAHFKCGVEGIFTVGTKWHGTGNVSFPPSATSLDATPTEITGPSVEYANLVTLENGVDGADMRSLDIDIVMPVVEKRVIGKAYAQELKRKGAKVTGTVELFFESDTRWARVRAGTPTTLRGTIVAGATQAQLDLLEVKLQPTGPKVEGEDGILQKYAYKAFRKTDITNTPIKMVTTCTTVAID